MEKKKKKETKPYRVGNACWVSFGSSWSCVKLYVLVQTEHNPFIIQVGNVNPNPELFPFGDRTTVQHCCIILQC